MAVGLISMGGVINLTFFALFPLAILFSIINAWNEEIFTRFTVIAGLHGKTNPKYTYWISTATFCVPHYFGNLGGIIGVLMTGFLGWLLAKSVEETKRIFFAWSLVDLRHWRWPKR